MSKRISKHRVGAPHRHIKIRRCSDCGSVRVRRQGQCKLMIPLLGKCDGRMHIIRYPTPEEVVEAERLR